MKYNIVLTDTSQTFKLNRKHLTKYMTAQLRQLVPQCDGVWEKGKLMCICVHSWPLKYERRIVDFKAISLPREHYKL